MVFEESYQSIIHICRLLMENENSRAKQAADKLILDHVDIHTSNEALLAHIIASSLLRRIDRELMDSKNIYLQSFDIPQIVLFYKMAEAYPQVAASHDIANQIIAERIKGLKEVAVFDIGIGQGKQMEQLVTGLAAKPRGLKKINILGLDPDPNNIRDSQAVISGLAARVPFALNFFPLCALLENFTQQDYQFIKEVGKSNLLVNAAYTMHHTAHPLHDYQYRTLFFKRIHALNPLLFTLIEPHVDHDIERISKRAHNCWHHFGTVFQLIDKADIGPEHKFLIKEQFFGREMRNMFSVSDHLRSERHERMDSWLLRFAKSGFVPFPFKDIEINLPDYCDYSVNEGLTQLGHGDVPLIAVFSYQSAGA